MVDGSMALRTVLEALQSADFHKGSPKIEIS